MDLYFQTCAIHWLENVTKWMPFVFCMEKKGSTLAVAKEVLYIRKNLSVRCFYLRKPHKLKLDKFPDDLFLNHGRVTVQFLVA